MVLKSGYLWIGKLRGAGIRIHWSVPLGVLAFTGFRLAPGAWLGFVLLILVHELGHALAVITARGLRLTAVDVLGFGGLCRFEGYPTPARRVLVAWGGVLAQAVLLAATAIALAVLGRPASPFVDDLAGVFTRVNGWVILVNLLPIPPLDGVEAWGVFPLLRAARARRRLAAEAARAAEERKAARAALPDRRAALDELEGEELAPMPDEVRRVLDRVIAEGRAEHESAKKK